METLLRAIDAVQTEGRPQMDGSKRGCVVVWAVSNNNKPITSADLESYDPLVCVAPSDKLDGRIASGYGATLDLVAPGKEVAVIDFVAENEWYIVGRAGSSLAAPIGAGVAALVLSKNPNLFWYEVIRILTVDSCDPEQPHNHTIDLGFGRLNALRAVKATPLR
jgi:subtilisin family serine protease